jgi:CO/xanthine dehydrogenase FAD-binding subunit
MSINAHPELPEFNYVKPETLPGACRFLAEHASEARPFLGGTDVFVRMRDGVWKEQYLVDVKHLDGTEDAPGQQAQEKIHFDPVSGLTIRSAVNMNQVIASPVVQKFFPVLAEACRTVASYQLRTRATIVGNICNASPAGDTIGACQVLNASLIVHGLGGVRVESLDGFFLAPGKTRLIPGDIVTAIKFPLPPRGAAGRYLKLGRNNWGDLAIAGVTVYAHPNAEIAPGYQFHIALASVAPVPLLAEDACDYLASHQLSPAVFKEAARIAQTVCNPIDDVRGSRRYRLEMVRKLTEQGLLEVWNEMSELAKNDR